MTKKVLTVFRRHLAVEKEIKFTFTAQEKDGRTVWSCEIEEETMEDLEFLMEITNV